MRRSSLAALTLLACTTSEVTPDATPEVAVTDTSAPEVAADTSAPEVAPTDATPATDTTPEVAPTDATPDAPAPEVDVADTDDAPEVDVADTDDAPACPAPPYGTDVGDTLADLALVDCDGNPVRLSAACDRPATYLNTFAGWCPPCRADAEDAPATYAALTAWGRGDALWLFVITEDAAGEPPTLAYCRAIRDDYDLPMTVLVDLDGALPDHLGVGSPNSWHLALARGMRVEALEKYDQDAVLEVVKDLVE